MNGQHSKNSRSARSKRNKSFQPFLSIQTFWKKKDNKPKARGKGEGKDSSETLPSVQVEDVTTLPNAALQVAPSHGSDQKLEPGAILQNAAKDRYETPPVAQEVEGVTGSPNADLQVAPSRGSGQEPGLVSCFQNANNISVIGGQFISTSGAININRPAVEQENRSWPDNAAGASPESTVGVSTSTKRSQTKLVMKSSNEIYEHHLFHERRGFPLWIPEPNKRSPLAYRQEGITIGDVGIITPAGAFIFLFNICVPSDNPINPRLLPEGFSPIDIPVEFLDIAEFNKFTPGCSLKSACIKNSESESDARLVARGQCMFTGLLM